MDGKSNRLNNF